MRSNKGTVYSGMVNSGARGKKKDRNRRLGWIDILQYPNTGRILIYYPIISKHLVPVNYTTGTPGDTVASGSSLVLPRAAADTRGQYSTLHYTGASIVRYAMQGQQRGAPERRREGGTRDEGAGEGAKEVARAAGGKAARAWVIVTGGRGGWRRAMEERM
jgi:hypothetical protein